MFKLKYYTLLFYLINILFLRLDIAQLQSMAQIHSYYITNAKSELRSSSSNNMSVDELETAIQEEEGDDKVGEDDIFSGDDINLDGVV